MGFRVAVLFGFVLLLSAGSFCSAAQNRPVVGTNQTQEQVAAISQQAAAEQQANRSDQSRPAHSPYTIRLRIHQLKNPAVGTKQDLKQAQENPPGVQPRGFSSQQARQWEEAAPARSLEPILLPGKEPKMLVSSERRAPVPADSVSVRCGEDKVIVAVQQNFLGNGKLIHPGDLTLGGCAAVDAVDRILLFQAELQGCGSTVKTTEENLVYAFPLKYLPTPIGTTPILKTNAAEVTVECHYQRKHVVSSGALKPTWETQAVQLGAEQRLQFSLRLMTEDWQWQRPSNVYYLNDVMHVEASVLQGHHVPLRVFVDSCVATMSPHPGGKPQYAFINNHGCLTDAKQTGEQSYFMQRLQENKLHFQLKTFRFNHEDDNSFYITCHLKATKLDAPIDWQHKACSFLPEAKRWVASGGDNKVCSCCDSSCSEPRRMRRSPAADAELQVEGTVVLGPILVMKEVHEELPAGPELPTEPVPELQTQEEEPDAASLLPAALLCGAGATLAGMVVFLSSVVCSRPRKPTVFSVSS
ncbi:zona pellucida sperm-binding protein 3 [Oryzias latipes]|uniref:Zona pellucida sperm-binding protein 3 n=1 Tax=Oryzias latipes TaxID=8090 RepID=H2LLA9_ORYLA|nr:zona pellucida sperm-binding protein 3 [Oryzias latipes]